MAPGSKGVSNRSLQVQATSAAHCQALQDGWSVTDDAALYERLGLPVQVLEAPASNIKLTTPFDLSVAEAVLRARGAETPAELDGPEAVGAMGEEPDDTASARHPSRDDGRSWRPPVDQTDG